jgi:hypothetical protein
MIAPVIVVSDERLDLGFEIDWQVIVFEQDTVKGRWPLALSLAQKTASLDHGGL